MADQLVFYHNPLPRGRIVRCTQRPAFKRAKG